MNIMDFYTEYVANWISSGNLINKDRMSALAIRPLFDRILTRAYATKVWSVVGIPVEFESNLTMLIRQEMFNRCPFAKVQIVFHSTPVSPNIQSDTFKRQMGSAAQMHENYKEVFENLKEDEKLTGKTFKLGEGRRFHMSSRDLERIRDRHNSYTYVYSHRISGGAFFKTHMFIQASVETAKEMRIFKTELMGVLQGAGIGAIELSGSMSKYLSNFGPAGIKEEDNNKKFQTMLLSDENISNMTSYMTRGLIGGYGILLGTDLLSKMPVIIDFFASPSAQVILIAAKAGEGKTALSEMMALQFLADDEKHVSVTDLKGGEWEMVSDLSDMLIVSMDDANPRFVNTMRLDDLIVPKHEAESVFNHAVKDTIKLYTLMINLAPNEGNEADLDAVLETAILKAYNNAGVVSSNPETFYKTKNIKLTEPLIYVEALKSSKSFEAQRDLCSLILTRCDTFFSSESRNSIAFRNEVSLAEIINTPFVIYSFNKNQDTQLTALDKIKVHMVAVLNAKKSYIRRKTGQHTIEIYEEGSRTGDTGDKSSSTGVAGSNSLLNVISHRVTGSRSNNVTIMLLTNSLSMFDDPRAKPIESNVTTVIAGKLEAGDIKILKERFNCESIIPYVEKISTSGDKKLKNSFAAKIDTGAMVDKAMFKIKIPASIERRIRTRDVGPTRKAAPSK